MAEHDEKSEEEKAAEEKASEEKATEEKAATEKKAAEEKVSADKKAAEEKDPSLLNKDDKKNDALDPSFFNEDKTINPDKVKEHVKGKKESDEKYEKRILDMRRKISDGKAPEKKDEYFKEYAPEDKFAKYFDPEAPDKEVIDEFKEDLSATYMEAGLTKRQGEDVSNVLLTVLEKVGVLDTRTKSEKIADKQKWIDKQKEDLGENAENIIREARVFIENASIFSAKTKNDLVDMMEELGSSFIDTIYQLKEAYGSGTGGVPLAPSKITGLADDIELKQEYLDPKTTNLRRQEIIALRGKANRLGKLMDAQI